MAMASKLPWSPALILSSCNSSSPPSSSSCSAAAQSARMITRCLCYHHPKPISESNTSTNGGDRSRITAAGAAQHLKRYLRCNTLYSDLDNSPTACSFHGHLTGDKGLFALAPPHQGIDGEWTDRSGVIVYKWNEKTDRPNTGSANWKKRWSCCSEYDENAPPCRRGWHVSFDDGFTLY